MKIENQWHVKAWRNKNGEKNNGIIMSA